VLIVYFRPITRWLYCVECPQYSTRSTCVSVWLSKWACPKITSGQSNFKAYRCRRRVVQCYSTGDSNVSFHKGTLAPPGKYNWACASFSRLESTTEMATDRFSRFCTAYGRKCLYFTMGAHIHKNCPFPWGIWTSHVTHDAFGPCESTAQTAPRLVQPSLHRWLRSVSILYNGLPVSPQNCPFPGIGTSCTWFIGSTWVRKANGNLIVSAVFAGLTSVTDWQSDRQTMSFRYPV